MGGQGGGGRGGGGDRVGWGGHWVPINDAGCGGPALAAAAADAAAALATAVAELRVPPSPPSMGTPLGGTGAASRVDGDGAGCLCSPPAGAHRHRAAPRRCGSVDRGGRRCARLVRGSREGGAGPCVRRWWRCGVKEWTSWGWTDASTLSMRQRRRTRWHGWGGIRAIVSLDNQLHRRSSAIADGLMTRKCGVIFAILRWVIIGKTGPPSS